MDDKNNVSRWEGERGGERTLFFAKTRTFNIFEKKAVLRGQIVDNRDSQKVPVGRCRKVAVV